MSRTEVGGAYSSIVVLSPEEAAEVADEWAGDDTEKTDLFWPAVLAAEEITRPVPTAVQDALRADALARLREAQERR